MEDLEISGNVKSDFQAYEKKSKNSIEISIPKNPYPVITNHKWLEKLW